MYPPGCQVVILLIDGCYGRVQFTEAFAPALGGKVSAGGTHPLPLYQFPASRFLSQGPALTSFTNEGWFGSGSEINPLLDKQSLVMVSC